VALPKFEYFAPKNIKEACSALAANPDGARLIAGGVSLLRVMKYRIMAPDCVIDVKAIPGLRYVEVHEGGLRIGAATTSSDVLRSEAVKKDYPLLVQAIGRIATTAVRNWATVVGNICVGHTASDPSAALLALDAELVVVSPNGERIIPVEQFFVGHMTTALDVSDFVREIRIPRLRGTTGMAYLAHAGRQAMETPLIGVAAILTVEDDKVVGSRLALAGAAEKPIRLSRTEGLLIGARISDGLVQAVADEASNECAPDSDVYASGEYRRRLVKVYVRDALRAAADRVVRENRGR
jgi:aerobic carbon-monoxide dehydrogenase medium subunit